MSAPVGGPNPDHEHLRLLALFHYIVAGVEALFGLIPIIHVAMGVAMLTGYWPVPTGPSASPMPDFMGWMFTIMGAVIILISETLALLTLLAGLSIAKRRRHLFCLIAAGVGCINMPFGTALAVFTFLVLLRPSVKALFQQDPVAEEAGPV